MLCKFECYFFLLAQTPLESLEPVLREDIQKVIPVLNSLVEVLLFC